MTGTPNGQPTGTRSEIYDELVKYRTNLIAKFEATTRRHEKNLAELDAAIAGLVSRYSPTVGVEYEQCRHCGGPLVRTEVGLVHDRSGSPACYPGHSGPVAAPLDQTAQLPQVSPDGATQVIPAVPANPWAHVHGGQHVIVHCEGGGIIRGIVDTVRPDTFIVTAGEAVYDFAAGDVVRVEPAEVSGQVTATPAVQEAGQADE